MYKKTTQLWFPLLLDRPVWYRVTAVLCFSLSSYLSAVQETDPVSIDRYFILSYRNIYLSSLHEENHEN